MDKMVRLKRSKNHHGAGAIHVGLRDAREVDRQIAGLLAREIGVRIGEDDQEVYIETPEGDFVELVLAALDAELPTDGRLTFSTGKALRAVIEAACRTALQTTFGTMKKTLLYK